jgi:2-methylcitrate dehydratase PrpD
LTENIVIAEALVERLSTLSPDKLPAEVRTVVEALLIDVAGLCVAARETDYVKAVAAGWDGEGQCTALGHARGFDAAGAAVINGLAAHGEDFDDTFEGGPIHAGAVIVPAVLAACERYGLDGKAALLAIAVGVEVCCRLSMVIPKAVHKAGFHPTSVFGAMGATVAVAVARGLSQQQTVDSLGIAGSMAGGIIEYLTDGTWTKRLHAGWAAQIGLRATAFGAHEFSGPRTVFEGPHGLFHGFARSPKGDYDQLLGDLGKRWVTETVAFKPYACGTMIHPYLDCAIRLAKKGVKPEEIDSIVCETAEGILHRLWEPLAAKQNVANAYAGKFSIPFCLALGFYTGKAGLESFTEEAAADPKLKALAGKVTYVVDPNNPYPKEFTGHVRVTLKDGKVIEERQPHIRGGAHEPLSRQEIEEKFDRNAAFGGWPANRRRSFIEFSRRVFDGGKVSLGEFRG